jgi:hypothetical protein
LHLFSHSQGKYQQLADDFVTVAMDGELGGKGVNVDEDIDVGGEYGLDELEGDDEPPSKKPNAKSNAKSGAAVKTTTASSTTVAVNQFEDADEDEFHPLNEAAITPKSVNVKQHQAKSGAGAKPTAAKDKSPTTTTTTTQGVKPLSEIMKNLHIETKGNVLSNFDYSAEEDEDDDEAAYEDADEFDGGHPLDHVDRIAHLTSAASKTINKFGGDDFDSVLRDFDDDEEGIAFCFGFCFVMFWIFSKCLSWPSVLILQTRIPMLLRKRATF